MKLTVNLVADEHTFRDPHQSRRGRMVFKAALEVAGVPGPVLDAKPKGDKEVWR